MNITIYLIRNIESKKSYVGQTRGSVHRRFCKHDTFKSKTRKQPPITFAIRKYGRESFDISVLEECHDQPSADAAERFWICYLQTRVPRGYNVAPGGIHLTGPRSAAANEKTRKSLLGRKHSAIRRLRQSLSHLGKPSWNKGLTGVVKPNSGSFKIGGVAPNKGRKKIVDASGRTRYVRSHG